MRTEPRKVVQFHLAMGWVYALCDDGSLWRGPAHDAVSTYEWLPVPINIPDLQIPTPSRPPPLRPPGGGD